MSAPALATVGGSATNMIISSVLLAQPGAEIVQRKVALAPIVKPVTPDNGSVGVVIVAVPDTTLHTPVPDVAVFAANVAVVTLHKV